MTLWPLKFPTKWVISELHNFRLVYLSFIRTNLAVLDYSTLSGFSSVGKTTKNKKKYFTERYRQVSLNLIINYIILIYHGSLVYIWYINMPTWDFVKEITFMFMAIWPLNDILPCWYVYIYNAYRLLKHDIYIIYIILQRSICII